MSGDNGREPTGWWNHCRRCGGRYWVRMADIAARRMRRFVGKDSDERHVCAERLSA